MSESEFIGETQLLDAPGLAAVTDLLGVAAPEVWSVLQVETRGCGFLPDRRPAILFERHIFHKRTKGKFDEKAPDVSRPEAGGYGAGGAHQYDRLAQALALDRTAALESASWGIGQVMGFNSGEAGFGDVETFVSAMAESESQQLEAMASFVVGKGLHLPLRAHDWTSFARGYNGSNFAVNRYDIRLAAAFAKLQIGPLPDLAVRAAQLYLSVLRFEPGPVDGLLGKFTRSALHDFLEREGLEVQDDVDDELLGRLRSAAGALLSGRPRGSRGLGSAKQRRRGRPPTR